MHLLAAQPGGIADGGEAVDLGQTPGDIVFASAADTELACLARAQASLGAGAPSLRLANLMNLSHNLSVDNWLEATVSGARLVIVRVLGGESYWPYGVERLTQMCREKKIALAADLAMAFDPLDCDMAAPWTGPRPACLAGVAPWRSHGDSVERLEELASALIAGEEETASEWRRTAAVLREINERIAPALDACGSGEMAGVFRALSGRFVTPGPSGAPSRGRPEVLPTGRNFYSLDSRTVPTQAAWQLGWKSAQRLVEYHAQRHGDWPRRMALSAWGTSNMRTGGDDIGRVVRARVVNPKWLAGIMRHGYKGAFEMAATVDYLFAFAATTGAVKDHHFDAVFDAYVADEKVRAFMAGANPAALAEMAARLGEALRRGLWKPRSNRAHDLLRSLAEGAAP